MLNNALWAAGLSLHQENGCEAFESAIHACPNNSRYVAAWAETKMAIIFPLDGPNDFMELYERLQSTAPAVLGVKARLLSAEKRDEEADCWHR